MGDVTSDMINPILTAVWIRNKNTRKALSLVTIYGLRLPKVKYSSEYLQQNLKYNYLLSHAQEMYIYICKCT
jgi:hypothetical protein